MNSCTQTKKRYCSDCGASFIAHDISWEGREMFRQHRCESCTEAEQQAYHAAEKRARIKRKQALFATIWPALYCNSDLSKLHSRFRKAAMDWKYGPRGLGLVGSVGTGKTRAAYFLLERMLRQDRTVWATNATAFARLCTDQFSDNKHYRITAERSIESIYQSDIWLLDDLGKQRMTERGEVDLYAVLEYRTARQRPTIWTSNAKGKALAARFSEERAEAIMRRLTDFSDIVTVWESEVARIQEN